jgi:hypothetical protein
MQVAPNCGHKISITKMACIYKLLLAVVIKLPLNWRIYDCFLSWTTYPNSSKKKVEDYLEIFFKF